MKALIVSLRVSNKSDIDMYVRLENSDKKLIRVTGFKPYFYVPDPLGEYKSIDGESVSKIVVDSPLDVKSERMKYSKTYEADIKYTRRFLIDNDIYKCIELDELKPIYSLGEIKPIECDIEPRITYLDIEVLSEGSSPINFSQPVISISIYDNYLKKYITWVQHSSFGNNRTYSNEVELVANNTKHVLPWELRVFNTEVDMLVDFIHNYWLFTKPDIVTGWNIWFDLEYLEKRIKKLFTRNSGVVFTTRFADILDLLLAYKSIAPRRHSYRLKWVTYIEGLETRSEAREGRDIIVNYNDDPLEVAFYNLRDVWRIVVLDQKYRITSYFLSLKWSIGVESIQSFLKPTEVYRQSVLKTMVLVDTLLLRTSRKRGIVLPNRSFSKNIVKKKYRGAIVFTPVKGVHENIAVFDIGRYYPSLIVSFNISPETINGKINDEVCSFRQDSEGMLPHTVKQLLLMRENLEKQREKLKPGSLEYEALENKIMVLKFITNAIYGVTGNETFRIFNLDVSKTITSLGREGLMYLSKLVGEMGYRVIYGDTDSIFIQVPFGEANELAKTLSASLQKYFVEKYGLKSNPLVSIKFEKYYSRVFFTGAKKRYAGLLIYEKGKEIDNLLDIVGFEAIKSDYPPLTHEFENELFKLVLNNELSRVNELFNKYVEEAKKRPLDDIALYKTLSKDLHEYKSNTPHVRAALWARLNLGLKYGRGSRVKYIYVKRVHGFSNTDVVAYEDEETVRDKIVIDWEKQVEAILVNPARVVLEPLGVSVGKHVSWSKKWREKRNTITEYLTK